MVLQLRLLDIVMSSDKPPLPGIAVRDGYSKVTAGWPFFKK
jgi:hypothetical protein